MSQQECPERQEALVEDEVAPAAPALRGFSAEERRCLRRLRRLVASGERSERYPVDKRQDFVRWLVDRGRLSDS